jgi:dTDP-4-dehydrorhamnose reductase
MRVLVIGGTGMLGHVLVGTLARSGHSVLATVRGARPHAGPMARFLSAAEVIPGCDVRDAAALSRIVAAARPDAVVNCVGVIKQKSGIDDPVETVTVNALLPHQLAAAAAGCGARLIQISTDCVFSGRRGGYAETDLPDPPDFYGRSKLLGEVAAPNLTLRTSMVGWQITGAESLLGWFWQQRGQTIRGFRRAFFSGLSTAALAQVIETVLRAHPGLSGLYHIAAPRISKHDLLAGLNARMGRPVTIEPDDGLVIDRSLDGSRLAAETGVAIPDWPEMLDELAGSRARYDDD